MTTTAAPSYKRHRYPSEIIDHCVWLYFRFTLSFRDVEELMLERGVVVSDEAIRRWCDKFGQAHANRLRRRRARPGDKWFLDEVFVQINGVQHYLWRAVDQDGTALSSCLVCSSFRAHQTTAGTGRSGSGGLFGDLIPDLESGGDVGAVGGGSHPVSGRSEMR